VQIGHWLGVGTIIEQGITMSTLASKQEEVLKLVQDREVSGTRMKYIWVFTAGSRVVTREVHALEYKGLVTISYYGGGTAAVNIVSGPAAV
jgi:hypothetical protein